MSKPKDPQYDNPYIVKCPICGNKSIRTIQGYGTFPYVHPDDEMYCNTCRHSFLRKEGKHGKSSEKQE